MFQKDVCWGRIAYARPLRRKKTNWATICRAVCNTPLLISMNMIKTGTAPFIYNIIYERSSKFTSFFEKSITVFIKIASFL